VAESRAYTIPVDTWNDVYIRGEFPLSESAWDRMMVVLAAMRPGLVLEEVVDVEIAEDDGDRCGWERRTPGWLPCDLPRGHHDPHHLFSAQEASGLRLSHYEPWSDG
jgi:hypothetical protein